MAKKENISTGEAILSFIIWPAGVVLYAKNRNKNPEKAKAAIMLAIMSFVVVIIPANIMYLNKKNHGSAPGNS